MEWAGGDDWESYVDKLADKVEDGVIKVLHKDKKLYPKNWEWKGEHWKIARYVMIAVCSGLELIDADTYRNRATSTYSNYPLSCTFPRYTLSWSMLDFYLMILSRPCPTRTNRCISQTPH